MPVWHSVSAVLMECFIQIGKCLIWLYWPCILDVCSSFLLQTKKNYQQKRTLKFTKSPANNHYTDTEALRFDQVISHTQKNLFFKSRLSNEKYFRTSCWAKTLHVLPTAPSSQFKKPSFSRTLFWGFSS